MRALERLEAKWEREDRERLEAVFALAEHNADVRYMLRWFLEITGYGRAPASADPLTLAARCGMLSVAEQLTDEMEATAPALLPALIKETTDERNSRTAARNARLADFAP